MDSAALRGNRARFLGLMGGLGLTLSAFAAVSAQAPSRPAAQPKGKPTTKAPAGVVPVQRVYRYAPSLGILMVAYEGVVQNNEQANPEIVRAMRKSFEANPSARRTFAKIHKAYRALPSTDREKIVGKELAQATGKTRLTRTVVEPLLKKHFQRKPPLLAEQAPSKVNLAEMKPLMVTDQEMRLDPESKVPERVSPLREKGIGKELSEGNSDRYRVNYAGLYCRQEPSDFGFSCEPYVIFAMKQGDSEWTRRKGPYDNCDSGDKYREHYALRSNTPFGYDLHVVTTVLEHDLGSIDEIEDAIQTGIDTLAGIIDIWWNVPDWLQDAVADALSWFADLFGLDDDQIDAPQAITFTKRYGETHTGHIDWEGFEYDTFQRFRNRGRRGDFYVFFDVLPIR